MTPEQAKLLIEKELATARHADAIGNIGMVRVCARRAAGTAITLWLQRSQRTGWGIDAMSQLRTLANETSVPQEVNDAAQRLIVKVTDQFAAPSVPDPIKDAATIINHLLGQA